MKRLLLMGLATLALTGGGAVGAVQPNDPAWAEQLGARQLGLPQVWETTTGDPGVLIATVDTGANGIPDLEGALVPGYDFVDNDFEPQDTHEAATAPGSQRARGARQQRDRMAGHCWGCRVLPVRVSANGSATPAGSPSGSGTPSTVAPASSTSASATRAARTRRRRLPSSTRSRAA